MKRQTKYPASTSEPLVLKDALALPPDPPAMVRTQIYLTQAEYHFLQAESQRRSEPMAAVLRAIVDEKMEMPANAWAENPMLQATPKDSKFDLPEDAAINHDHYLYGTPKKYGKVKGHWVLNEEAGR